MNTETKTEIKSYLDWAKEGKASLWRYILGFALTSIVFLFISGFGAAPLEVLVPDFQSSPILSTVALLMSFVIAFFTIPLIVRWLHQRPYWSVAMAKPGFDWRDLLTGFGVGLVVGLVAALLFHVTGILPLEPNPDFSLAALLPLAVIGPVGIFIQAGAEELLFRGYFTQFFRSITDKHWLFIGIPALLFAAPHIGNIESLGGGIFVLLPYLISGLLFGWAAYRSGSLWLGLGLHLVNNYTGLVFAGAKGDELSGPAPFLVEVNSVALAIAAVSIQTLAIVIVLHFILKRREA